MTTTNNKNTNNTTAKAMDVKALMGMTVKAGDKVMNLVKFIPNADKQYIDDSVTVADDYAFPKKAVNGKIHPVYFACALNVNFSKDVKNVTTGTKEEKAEANAKILENAVGFKAVCRDLTALAGNTEKGFLKMTGSMPCEEKVNPNGSITGLWVFTSKALREEFLKMVRNGVNSGKYHLNTGEKKAKELKKVKDFATLLGVSYEDAYKLAVEKGLVKK